MLSILNEITKLRSDTSLSIDRTNSNRYRVVLNEDNFTKTAYYFSTPIYNMSTKKAVDMKFHTFENYFYLEGSNSSIIFSDKIKLENHYGYISIDLPEKISLKSEYELHSGTNKIFPTTNGFAYMILCPNDIPFSFDVESSIPFLNVRSNNKCFSLMREKFEPFFTVSCIGTSNLSREIIAPAKLICDKITDRKYKISVTPSTPVSHYVLIEINMYESKLFQDTTVESKNPMLNNAFGSIAYIGTTKEFGEQWLYTRPDFSILSDLLGKRILKAVFHIPTLNITSITLTGYSLSSRFCSFGSNWDNKMAMKEAIVSSNIRFGYQDMDVTKLLTNKESMLERSEGLIIKSKTKNNGFSVMPTGDSYYAPQILEINYEL